MRNAKKCFSLVLFMLLTNIGLLFAQSESYTLDDYLKKVEAKNLDIALSRLNVLSSAESVKQARSALLPAIGASGGYTRNLTDREQSTPIGASTTTVSLMHPLIYQDLDTNYDNELSLGLGIDQKIFDAAALARYQQSKTGRVMQETVSDYTRQMIITAAKKLYAQAQLAQAVSGVMKEAEKTSEETYRSIQRMYAAGTTTELNLLMAEVDWKNNISSTIEAERNAAVTMLALKDLAGISQNIEITLTEETRRLPETPPMPDLNNVLASRPDYRTQVLSKELADLTYRASIGTFLPTVSARFSYAYGQQGGYEGKNDWNALNYSVLQLNLTASIPLFVGGYRTSLVRDANISRARAEINIQKSRNTIEQELLSLVLKMGEARQKLQSAETLEAAAVRAMTLAQASLENGLGTRLSVSEANTNLARTRLNLQRAVFDYRTAYYDWQLAVGRGGD
jgi:outer membrane protein TolC